MLILVTNDDGIHSPGIRVLADHLAPLGEVLVVAPDRERSAVGHSLTLQSPLRAEEIESGRFAVDGTPTDCVHLGIHGLLERRPDLVVAGINRGSNLGEDITYSGTVSGAMEATLMGVPAFAVSLEGPSFQAADFAVAADFARRLARQVLERGLPPIPFSTSTSPPARPAGSAGRGRGRGSTATWWWKNSIPAAASITGSVPGNWDFRIWKEPTFTPFGWETSPSPPCISISPTTDPSTCSPPGTWKPSGSMAHRKRRSRGP